MSSYNFKLVKNERFNGETVRVDGIRFDSCKFDKCILEFGATAPFEIIGTSETTDVQWRMVEHAGSTIQVLRLLNQGGWHDTVQQICDHILGRGLADQTPRTKLN